MCKAKGTPLWIPVSTLVPASKDVSGVLPSASLSSSPTGCTARKPSLEGSCGPTLRTDWSLPLLTNPTSAEAWIQSDASDHGGLCVLRSWLAMFCTAALASCTKEGTMATLHTQGGIAPYFHLNYACLQLRLRRLISLQGCAICLDSERLRCDQ